MKSFICYASAVILLVGCSTQRYGREQPLSSHERRQLTCREITIQIDKTETFLSDVRMQRTDTSGAHVLGFLGDFGIGNMLEGDAAELSGQKRLKELKDLKAQKGC